MAEFSRRSQTPEYMDRADVAGADLARALEELTLVNRFLGGYRATLKTLEQMVEPASQVQQVGPLWILDLGTGAADIPIALVVWARRRKIPIHIVAVDFNFYTCAWAARRTAGYAEITVQQADVFALPYKLGAFDIVHCAMFLHHFAQAEAAVIVQIMYGLCRQGIIINDLQRHPLAYYAVSWGMPLLSKSSMVKHDAPVSVLRGFRRADLLDLALRSGLGPLKVKWRWAFRYVATLLK
jgi:SAM-dependent methyltransferase